MHNYSKDRKSNPIKWPLLALLLLLPISVLILRAVPHQLSYYLCPLGFLHRFLLSWFDGWWLVLLLSLLPLIGWLLMHLGKKKGKWIANGVLSFLLAADLFVFFLHFITTLSGRNVELLKETLFLALACPVVCIPALVLTNKWYPKI